jgi:hypothetical protein
MKTNQTSFAQEKGIRKLLFVIFETEKTIITILILIAALFIIIGSAKAQQAEFCGQSELTKAWFQKHPDMQRKYGEIQQVKASSQPATRGSAQRSDSIIYTIPLVFHILHIEGIENISDEQIFDEVAILNRDYQKKNADTSQIVSHFANNIANVGFAFKLATIDPDGKCTNGIVRHYTPKSISWDANKLEDFIYTWPTNKYLNIYVVRKINIATAYTFLPGIGIPDSADVIVCQHNMVGSIGTGTVANSRVLTHEIAHWFDIQHIWGITNAPGVACGDDLIQDTPETKGFSTCNTTNSNVCDPNIFENVQNYMDYSPCKIMFTNGQADRMYATIASGVNNRDNIFTVSNQLATGIIGSLPCNTRADFYSSKPNNCIYNTITYKSLSQFGNSTGSLLWNFPGGFPSSSADSVAIIEYPSPGVYSVSLTASGPNGTNTATKTNYVKIEDGYGGQILPYINSFEDTNSMSSVSVVNLEQDTIRWKLNNNLGANSTSKCIYLENFPDSVNFDYTDWFETPYFDFTNTTNATLSFYYAYAKRYATQLDSFRVQYTLDCGGSWANLSNIPGTNFMATNSGGVSDSSFIPTSAQWKKVTVPETKLTALNNKQSVKFRFYFKTDYYMNGANNFYLDEINLTGEVIANIETTEVINDLTIYPNPSNTSIFIEFLNLISAEAKIELIDVTGRLQDKTTIEVLGGTTTKHVINSNRNLTPGIYLATISIGNQKVTRKIVLTDY